MRYVAQAKQGFYPAAPEAVRAWAAHLRLTDADKTCLLDPCAGKGDAIKTLRDALGVPNRNVFAVELDAGRGQQLRDNLEGGIVLAPADSFQIKAQIGRAHV